MRQSEFESNRELQRLRGVLVELELQRASLLFGVALRKFRPDQLRVPPGNPDGGQWVDEGTVAGDLPIAISAASRSVAAALLRPGNPNPELVAIAAQADLTQLTPQAAQAFNKCRDDPKAKVEKDIDGRGTDVCYTGNVREVGSSPDSGGGYYVEFLVGSGGALFTMNLDAGDTTGTIVNSNAYSESVRISNGVMTNRRNTNT